MKLPKLDFVQFSKNIDKDVKNLNLHKWGCSSCPTHHNSNINASINLKNGAIKLLTARTVKIAQLEFDKTLYLGIPSFKRSESGRIKY